MIGRLIELSLRHRWSVVAAGVALMIAGIWQAGRMPMDVFPDLNAPRVTVVTEATGMAPEDIERLITFPIESTMNGVHGVRTVRSASAPGISVVWVEFDWDTAPELARQRVNERLPALSMPPEASTPLLAPPSSVMGEIAFIALVSDEVSGMELRRMADVEVRRRLLAVGGVSQIVSLGGNERQYQVILEPSLLERYELGIGDVVAALGEGSRNAPGGFVVSGGQESVVRVLGRAHDEKALAAIVVTLRDGVPVRVDDLGEVRVGAAVVRGTASYRGRPAVVMSIVKQPDADTLSTTDRVDAALDELAAELAPRGILLKRDVFRQADFIERAVSNLLSVLRDGAILVVVVLALFLWSLRPTLISALAIPLSLLTAVLVMAGLGLRLDTMTLGGMAIAVGELVDDAIVDVENVVRRLRERATLSEDVRPAFMSTVLHASLEVRSAIVSATVVIMLVFLPLLFLEGLEGRLLRPLAIAYLVAIAASLLVAVTITPALCSLLLRRSGERGSHEPPLLRWLHRRYEPVVHWSLRHPGKIALVTLLWLVVGVAGVLAAGRSFLPEFNEGSLTIAAVTLPGTSLEQSDALARMGEEALLADPAVVSTSRRTGRAEADEHVQGVEASEIEVLLRPDPRSKEELMADLRERLATVPGMQFTLGQPISHRIDHMISGQRAALSIKVFGEDLGVLRRAAEQVRGMAALVPGLVDVTVEPMVDIPQVSVRIDPERASRYGLSAGAAAGLVGSAMWGSEAGRIYEHGTLTEIVVRYPDDVRTDIESVSRMRVPVPTGAFVPLAAFADISRDSGPNYILREGVQRRVVVTANVAGRDLRAAYEDVRARVTTQKLPPGVRVAYAGQFEREEAAGRRLLILTVLVLFGIALVLGTTLGSARRTLIVMVNLPLALAGGVVGVYIAGGVLSVATTIGFITLFGIATRNGILLATRTADLEAEGVPLQEAVIRSARERLAPILMTAVTAALGLLPLAVALGEPGSEIQAPMALVILTGLTSSTLLNMVVVPAFLARWGGEGRRHGETWGRGTRSGLEGPVGGASLSGPPGPAAG